MTEKGHDEEVVESSLRDLPLGKAWQSKKISSLRVFGTNTKQSIIVIV